MRTAVADSMELLLWERKHEGNYKSKDKRKKRMKAYTRTLMAKIMLKQNVGYMGKEIRVAVCHLHHQVANKSKGFRRQNDAFWPWLANKLKEHNIQVLMGDFNMSLFKVVPELRSRGVPAQLAAWYPWRIHASDQPMCDSCGIFMCVPCTVAPKMGMNIFDEGWWKLNEHEPNGGPGQALFVYLPKADDIENKVRVSLEPAVAEGEAEESAKGKDKGKGKGKDKGKGKGKGKPNQRTGLSVKEKMLDASIWRYQGKQHSGAHFPLAAFTDNVGRRSEERYVERNKRYGKHGW